MSNQYCNKPDRDAIKRNPNTKMECGYPLPCPYHTIVIDLTESPTTTIPPNNKLDKTTREHVSEIVNALKEDK